MAEKKKIPEIRFKEFDREWKQYELGQLLGITSASRVHKNEWTKSGVPFFRSSDVVADYKGLKNNKAFISFDLYEELSNKSGSVQKNDLLVTGGGSIGIPYLVKNDDPLYFKDADLLWLKNFKNINGYFLYTFFSTLYFRRYVSSITHIGTISHYTIEQAKSTPIKAPERKERDKIGKYLIHIDTLISLHQQKLDKLLNVKKSMLEKMFPKKRKSVPEIRFKGFSEQWEEKNFIDILDKQDGIRRGPFGSSIKKSMFVKESDYVVYEQQNAIYDRYETRYNITKKKYDELIRFKVSAGDFIMSGAGTIGKISRVPIGIKQGVFNQALIRININSEILNSDYFLKWMKSDDMQRKLTEANPASAMVNLVPMSEIKSWNIRIPKKTEQTKIGKVFKNFDNLLSLQKIQLKKLKNIKKSCLEKMFV